MTQRRLPLTNGRSTRQFVPEFAEAVGLKCEDEMVTLRFVGEGVVWGQPVRQIRLNRRTAEQLSRILDQELFED